jgi:hypothetical protein
MTTKEEITFYPNGTILEKLSEARIVDFTRKGDEFEVSEACDCYFNAILSKSEMLQLIEELKELVK